MYRPVLTCPLCNAIFPKHDYFIEVVGKLWSEEEKMVFPLPLIYKRCSVCGLVFQSHVFKIKAEREYYRGVYRKTIQGGRKQPSVKVAIEQNRRAKNLLKYIEEKIGQVEVALDVGCSTGELLRELWCKYGCEPVGVEPDSGFKITLLPCIVVPWLSHLPRAYLGTFDFISVIHTLEHISLPVQFLASLKEWATPNGWLLVEVPNLVTEYTLNTAHPVAFTRRTLSYTLAAAGWEIVDLVMWKGNRERRLLPSNILALCKPGEEKKIDYKLDRFPRLRHRLGQLWIAVEGKRLRAKHG